MANSPTGRAPIDQFRTVVDVLETPALARIYGHALDEGPVTVGTVVDDLGVPQGTAYEYVRTLTAAGLLDRVTDQRPYEYDADPISLTLSTDAESRTITPALVAAVARRDVDADVDAFVDRHGIDGLARALEYADAYVDGTVNHRIAARELDLSPIEAEVILQALEPIAKRYPEDAHNTDESLPTDAESLE